MSVRPVYLPKATRPYYTTESYEFDWNPGQSAVQKKKNSKALRDLFTEKHPDRSILEVSTKSDSEIGQKLSPFHLTLRLPTLRKEFPVENILHASKAFRHGGPYVDLLGTKPAAAKKDPRLLDSGDLVHYVLENQTYPVSPPLLFYNWIYVRALMEHPGLAQHVKTTDAFCDIEFNPDKGTNNQAQACAIYHSLAKLGLLEQARTFEGFKKLMLAQESEAGLIKEQSGKQEGALQLNDIRAVHRRHNFQVGDWLDHPSIGKGEVIRKNKDTYVIRFRVSGPKTIARDFVELNCKPVSIAA